MPDKPTVVEKTIIKEIHDTPVNIDLDAVNNRLDAILAMMMDIETDISKLKSKQDGEAKNDVSNAYQTILALLTAIATEVGQPPTTGGKEVKEEKDPMLVTILTMLNEIIDTPPTADKNTNITLEALRKSVFEIGDKQDEILTNTQQIKEIL